MARINIRQVLSLSNIHKYLTLIIMTFSPTAHIMSIQILMDKTSQLSLIASRMNIKTAYLKVLECINGKKVKN